MRHLVDGEDPDAERIYRWHIEKRTGGREPRSWKRTVDCYVSACRSLLRSMESGFDPDFAVEYGKNGRLRDGAHRIACALVVGKQVFVRVVPVNGHATWEAYWFVQHGIARADLQRIEADFEWLKQH